jgi:hypothetical protein
MRYITVFAYCLILACGHLSANESSFHNHTRLSGSSGPFVSPDSYLDDKNPLTGTGVNGWPVVIHYGLNDSHSKSWVQEDANGVIGISYFERYDGNYTDGILIYKTIQPDGSPSLDTVTSGTRMEKSVLLFDEFSNPHIFVARSNNENQFVEHHYKDSSDIWQNDTIINFYNVGGKFIYELSADTGPDGSFHLLILKSRSDIDSDDYNWAWLDSYLYYMTNASGAWATELIRNYNMGYTYDTDIKTSCRQDIRVDSEGFAHVVFREQIYAYDDPSRLWYCTNKGGAWLFEIAFSNDFGIRDDVGWFPSLCLDNNDIPHISCMYVHRVYTRSVVYCRLYFLKRLGSANWQSEIVADSDDGYYASDGRSYTGGLTHLVFDAENTPHIIFSDIASAHWGENNSCVLNVGNIRYAVLRDGVWNLSTIYRQPKPLASYNAYEMHGMCLVVSDVTDSIRIIGEEMEITDFFEYDSRIVDFSWADIATDIKDEYEDVLPDQFCLYQNFPNPFNLTTSISYNLPCRNHVTIEVFNLLGQRVQTLVDKEMPAGSYMASWNGTSITGRTMATGVYVYRFRAGDHVETKKMLLLK